MMISTSIEQRLRTFLLVVAAMLCVGTAVELVLAEHYETAVQAFPFVLCGLGLVAVLASLLRPSRRKLLAVRLVMALLIGGSAFGVYQHVEHNIEFEREIRPSATTNEVLLAALRGANPLLAPGILSLAGVLAIAGTYGHPALARTPSRRGVAAPDSGVQPQ